MSVISSTSASSDVEITISAGLFRRNWGCFGCGWVIVVYNNGNEPINGSCEIDYYTLSGDNIRREEANFNLGPLTEFGYEGVNIIDFPPINQLTITVEAGGPVTIVRLPLTAFAPDRTTATSSSSSAYSFSHRVSFSIISVISSSSSSCNACSNL